MLFPTSRVASAGNVQSDEGILFSRLAAFCGLLAPIVFWIGVILVGWLQPDYNPLTDTVSKMGRVGRPLAELANGTLIVTGLLLALFAQALPNLRGRTFAGLSVSTLFAFFGLFGLAGAGLLPCDQYCEGMSAPNILHTLPVALGFASLQVGLLQMAAAPTTESVWRYIPETSQSLFWAGSAAMTAFLLGRWAIFPQLEAISGLSEKTYLALLLAFVFTLARRLYLMAGKS